MTISDRDRKLLTFIVPVVALLAFWFLLLAPKREEAATAGTELTKVEQKRDVLEAKASQMTTAKATFARDYRDVVRLGKAIPSKVDLPSLIVQLDTAAKGTGIKFTKIKTGERDPATAAPATPPAGGAQSGPGKAAEAANGAKTNSDARDSASGATDTSTSTSSKSGGLAVGGGAAGAASAGASAVPGLDTVPLEFQFDGTFFGLADFFHRLKRFVKVTNEDLQVRGRLMTIDSMKFDSQESTFPDLGVEVKATVYLSPEKEGTTAGATPSGPATTTAAAPAGKDSSSPSPATPTAASTP